MPLTIAQIARQHDVTAATVRNWIDPGLQVRDPEGGYIDEYRRLVARKNYLGHWRVEQADLHAFLEGEN
ncbi:hypothetical protein CMI37_06735 [Candidatus Pacearchaeota archaeon]|jgi:hypothetical protein|nr:hypothetical protein [Candidatus Pacearchaeota archaeon]